jgi:glycosyltransferase involved in cell wall biosynthesis
MNQATKRLIKKYNNENNCIVISEFPSREKIKNDTALARYGQNTISSLKINLLKENRKVIVLADIITKEEIYEQEDVLIIRCLKRNNIASFGRVIYYAFLLNKVKVILFEFEFAAYGNTLVSSTIPIVLLAFKLLGKKTFFALHQVVSDIKTLNIHLNLSKKSPFLFILGKGLHIFYFMTGILADKIIVLEDELKSRLSSFVNPDKIMVIPHGIEQTELASKPNGKDFVLLSFGYIAWYKGLEELITTFNKMPKKINGKNLKLIIAGGKGVAQKGKPHYEQYYNRIVSLAKNNPRITLTDFVPEKEIKNYFMASDLCIYPYKAFISSSGPLSFGVTYQKPLVLSNNLVDYLKSEDFNQAFIESKLSKNDLFIKINPSELERIIIKAISNKTYQQKMGLFTNSLLTYRNWNELAKKYFAILFADKKVYRQSILNLIKLRLDFL